MTEVVANCHFNKTDFSVKNLGLELDPCQAAEVEAILKSDCKIWKSVEKHESMPIPEPVMKAAEFAVRKHNEEAHTHLELVSVLKWYVAADILFELLMSVKDKKSGSTHNATALVICPKIGPMKLILWKDLLNA